MPPESPRAFARRADGFRHAAAGGLWLAPLVYLEHARFGAGWYGKVVSADPERLLAWAVSKAIPRRALEVKSLPDLDMPRKGRRRLPGYHIDLWGARLALAYDPETLARARERSITLDRLQAGAGNDHDGARRKIQHPGTGDRRG
ncbi:MAG TPA: hypothetical protein VGR77_02755 [Candidatus Dormibacteraeota bacterium]|nr:hypothetical protein [Candidatus Dormibacteraeota bacterium]